MNTYIDENISLRSS